MENRNPLWWKAENSSTWERVKEAMHRDWEQTKADLSKTGGQQLNQQVGDTVRQAVGKEAIPPEKVANPAAWDRVEPAVRYGYGARSEYGQQHTKWDPNLEDKLHGEWDRLENVEKWEESKYHVKWGWEAAKQNLHQNKG